jgi:hypothetical protein
MSQLYNTKYAAELWNRPATANVNESATHDHAVSGGPTLSYDMQNVTVNMRYVREYLFSLHFLNNSSGGDQTDK